MIEKSLSKRCSSRGMYIRRSSDIPPNWKDIRNSYIPMNWNDIRSTSDMNELGEMGTAAEAESEVESNESKGGDENG